MSRAHNLTQPACSRVYRCQSHGKRDCMTLFDPEALAAFDYYPSADVLYLASRAELAVTRVDEWLSHAKFCAPIANEYLVSLDAVSSGRISGSHVSLTDLFLGRLAYAYACKGLPLPEDLAFCMGDLAAPEIKGYRACLEGLSTGEVSVELIDGELLLRMFDTLSEGGASYRANSLVPDFASSGFSFAGAGYRPSEPSAIEGLMDDLLSFCNESYSTPLVQTAVAHFRFEAIVPFSAYMDYIGRLLCHAVLYRRGLERSVCMPIGMYAALFTKEHAVNLFPYKSTAKGPDLCLEEALDNFMVRCALSTEYAAKVALIVSREIQKMLGEWTNSLGETRRDSAINAIVQCLPRALFFNAEYLEAMTGRSRTAVNAAIKDLQRCGIVEQTSVGKRNRVYKVPAVARLLQWIDNSVFPRSVESREDYAIPFISAEFGGRA